MAIITFQTIIQEGRRKYHGSMGAGVLPFCSTTKRFLVMLRSTEVMEPGTYGTIGGKIEESEQPMEAVKREFLEETGAEANFTKLIPAYVYSNKSFTYHNFLGVIEQEFEPTLNWESDGYKWLTLKELIKLKNKHYGLASLLKFSGTIIKSLVV